jgi:hypothetical protein
MLLVSRSADRRRERRWHLALTAVLAAVGLTLSAAFGHNTTIAMIGLTLGAMGGLSTLPLFWSLPTAFLGGSAAAAGIALINSWGNLMGFVKDMTHSTNLGMYIMSGALVLGALLTFLVPADVVNR